MSKVKIGVMSFAHMHAYGYAQALTQCAGVDFVGVADDDQARAKAAAGQFGVKAFDSYSDMLASDIQAVVVCSENVNHRRHVALAAQSGKHILCEKPLAATLHDAEAIIEIVRRSDVRLMTAFPCRFHPAYKQLKASVKSDELGKVLAIKATNQGKCPWGWFVDKSLSGGGAVMDHTVHLVDLMRDMTGSEPVRVYAEIGNRMYGKDFDDTGILTVDFADGMFATIDCSWFRPKSYPLWGNVNMEVVGTNGAANMEMYAQNVDYFSDENASHTYVYWGDDTNLALVSSFADSIRQGRNVEISGEDGMAALRVAMAAYESAKSGRAIDLRE
ncbi:MAG: Gfo/Idh/MocA family oxidoreductase [Armatimonadota bacterium]|nr:Gfo/Idh/MocA family oxidoreductase [bacterium]